jgi:sulfide:quinone oxidoreductase
MADQGPLRVLIAGGGIAALEAALALRELAGDRVALTMLAPEREFVCRPMTVGEPFGGPLAPRWELASLVAQIGAQLRAQALAWLDPRARVAHTTDGDQLAYDALLLAVGARRHERFRHAITLDDRYADEQLRGLLGDIEQGYVKSVAFLVPGRVPWPLPVYELALMTAERAQDMNVPLAISIITPERAPLEALGDQASHLVAERLSAFGIRLHHADHGEVVAPGRVRLGPAGSEVVAERLIALPQLFGPSIGGVPRGAPGGFVRVDHHCAVIGLERVWAAGDVVDFPVKLGGLAAQQADAAAESIAALAGVRLQPRPLTTRVEVVLLGGGPPLYLSAELVGGHATHSQASTEPRWPPERKIVARRLVPFLDSVAAADAR